MWKPVSKLEYRPLDPKGQIIVVACSLFKRDAELQARWEHRACALLHDSGSNVRDVVRDLLANPHVRAIVFDGPACGRDAYDKFWAGETRREWRIDEEHLGLVRRFVDLFDDDCTWKAPPQPFWPARILYLEEVPSG